MESLSSARTPGCGRTSPAVEASLSRGVVLALDDRQQAGGQLLAEFHAPLVEGVDVEELRLDEVAVFVERDQPANVTGSSLR